MSVDTAKPTDKPAKDAPTDAPTIEQIAAIIGSQRARTRWTLALVGLLGVAIGAGGVWAFGALAGGDNASSTHASVALTTVAAEVRDVNLYTEYAGTLGYGDAVSLGAGTAGVVTTIAAEGTDLARGARAYKVDGEPVIVLYGSLPVWRELSRNSDDGPDVLQLEKNLAALGYTADGNMTVDDEFTYYTYVALKEFEDDHGYSNPDGVLTPGEVVYVGGPIRVDSAVARGTTVSSGEEVISAALLAQVTDKVKGDHGIVSTETATQSVTLAIDTADQGDFSEGLEVEVELADERVATGVVTDIGDTAYRTGSGPDSALAVDVEISITEIPEGGLIEGPVVVRVPTETLTSVVMVPVRALVALEEGGYAVEVSDGTATHYVGVETGVFQDGWVEVTGDVAGGDQVVVPA